MKHPRLMLRLAGGSALPEFRLKNLLKECASLPVGASAASVEATRVYFLNCREELTADSAQRVELLLGASSAFDPAAVTGGFFVTPRKGTISPWSSKATDIFHNCGLTDVERVEHGIYYRFLDVDGAPISPDALRGMFPALHDRMTEGVYDTVDDLFDAAEPPSFESVDVLTGGQAALETANRTMGLALSEDEISYLCDAYTRINRNPSDVELLMFAQVNSEHCRHKIFNAEWVLDGEPRDESLFDMIRHTHAQNPAGTLVAYKDNSGVLEGHEDAWFEPAGGAGASYAYRPTMMDIIMKVETHNHPTAISPFPGAATGVGGEIRDEGATGTGSRTKAGLSAFMVSNLRVPGFEQPWERELPEFPQRLASPLQIMLEGPIGGAQFGNEFGRPQLLGLFRTYEDIVSGRYRGYHKPIMVAGGMGNIKRQHVEKTPISAGALVIQLGGPALRIGLGGGAASSMATGANDADLDFDSVQRGNAEMERRCQEVINACISLDDRNPILSIHDVGAGGLSNACPELVEDTGASFELRQVPNEEPSMSPMEIWCCEAQERYVLAIAPADLERFQAICRRERCPAAVLGEATGDGHLRLTDKAFDSVPIDIDLSVLLGKPPRTVMRVSERAGLPDALQLEGVPAEEALNRVLRLPSVAKKTFLISITDRTVTGMVARDQMVGPWQEPVADCAVTTTSLQSFTGEAMAMGERTPVAMVSAPASGRLAVGEALLNIAGADVQAIGRVKLSGNWMCACGESTEDRNLFETVEAVGKQLCPELGVAIPVGKDSLSMRTVWEDSSGSAHRQTAPLSLVISAFSPVNDVRKTVTPDLKPEPDAPILLLDLGAGKNRLGGSALAQVFNQVGPEAPDLDSAETFRAAFGVLQSLVSQQKLLAYHDRSDGGLAVTLAEMCIAGRRGAAITLDGLGCDALSILFAEELGAVMQTSSGSLADVLAEFSTAGLESCVHVIGKTSGDHALSCTFNGANVLNRSIYDLNHEWAKLTHAMQARRDNPACADEEFTLAADAENPGMNFALSYDPEGPFVVSGVRPRVAVLREQGVNGHVEMAAAFDRAGFDAVDVHMTDLMESRLSLQDFRGLVACGGFSYGDVLGAGSGWAKSVLFNENLRDAFAEFFGRSETFALGVCNGCQMLSQLKSIIPGAEGWPAFVRNACEQFEARYLTVEVLPSPSIFFTGMEGSRLPIPVAHGEGRAEGGSNAHVSLRYVGNDGAPASRYPHNPNGSVDGVTGFTTTDGRVTIMMPHPERAFRAVQLSYRPAGFCDGEAGPWLRMFQNARRFADA